MTQEIWPIREGGKYVCINHPNIYRRVREVADGYVVSDLWFEGEKEDYSRECLSVRSFCQLNFPEPTTPYCALVALMDKHLSGDPTDELRALVLEVYEFGLSQREGVAA